jgi:hypothetical protein
VLTPDSGGSKPRRLSFDLAQSADETSNTAAADKDTRRADRTIYKSPYLPVFCLQGNGKPVG